jgi:predicted RNA-binding Zn-ribbon protein involved in translation (DUF1610 family)
MGAKAGEIARENAAYRCTGCHRQINVTDGYPIPDCPQCGSGSFLTGTRTLQNQPMMERLSEAL